jgi:hypothetical protein
VQRNVTARFESSGEADADLTALNPGIRPALLLIKQADQVSVLNGRVASSRRVARTSPHRRHHVFGAVAGEDRDPVAIFVTVDELGRRVELGDDVNLPDEIKLD